VTGKDQAVVAESAVQMSTDPKQTLADDSEELSAVVLLKREQAEEMFRHARAALPQECCGLVAGKEGRATSVYPLRNVAVNPAVAYEAAPEDIFAAQRSMRAKGELLLGIYHSHPRSADPVPSETDVRLAYYPQAVYFIIGFSGEQTVLRAFRLFEAQGRWEAVPFAVLEG